MSFLTRRHKKNINDPRLSLFPLNWSYRRCNFVIIHTSCRNFVLISGLSELIDCIFWIGYLLDCQIKS